MATMRKDFAEEEKAVLSERDAKEEEDKVRKKSGEAISQTTDEAQ